MTSLHKNIFKVMFRTINHNTTMLQCRIYTIKNNACAV